MSYARLGLIAFVAMILGNLRAADSENYEPRIAPASKEAQLAIPRIRVPQGLKVDLFAAEPMLANPVAFCIDEKGRFYVAETFRLHAGVTDIRGHMNWLDDDLACRTVDDRVALYRKYLGKNVASYARDHDRVRLIEDTDGDGNADRSQVFADGFNHLADGIGSGVLARNGNVWFACIPDLWLLRDTRHSGKADVRKSLHHGYGVHVSFIGHDLHGLKFGPDGKLYFSIGDRGMHVEMKDRIVSAPDTGAVLRCNPDGSDLEIFATGLRNPQELAFEQHGNLFTCDNNADHGDKARCVYVVEGGDSGWRIGYQHLRTPVSLGPWNHEKLWHPRWDGQAAYIIPPLANLGDGPSGLVYHPGVACLPEHFRKHFFLADFRGSSGQSGIRSFSLKPKGAGFEVTDSEPFAWSILATDVDFGPDGIMYFSDWVNGWNKPNKGRIYKVFDPKLVDAKEVRAVRELLGQGMTPRSDAELAQLLAHADMRVRQEAQFALADRGAMSPLTDVARNNANPLARLHAIWGLGQLERKQPGGLTAIIALLSDADTEVRAQSAKVLGDNRCSTAFDRLVAALGDREPRVRFFAALGLGKIGRAEAIAPLLQMLRDNDDQDVYLRHAAVMGLAGCNRPDALIASADDPAPAVRMGILLALRRLEHPEVARFLNDTEPKLVLESARAINDVPIPSVLPRLAALSTRPKLAEPLLLRALNAHFRLGKPENAKALAALAARADAPEVIRAASLQALSEWANPSGRDKVVGLWRPLTPRPQSDAVEALAPVLKDVLQAPDAVHRQVARVVAKLGMKDVGPALAAIVKDEKRQPTVRVEMLRALDRLDDLAVPALAQEVLSDADPRLRAEGRSVLARRKTAEAAGMLASVLADGDLIEKQAALTALGECSSPAADSVISKCLDELLAGKSPAEIHLELLEAAQRRKSPGIKEKLARFESRRTKDDPLASYRESLVGGDAEVGRRIFFERAEVSCLRCHKVKGEGGEVGPDLAGIGGKQKREYLLEAIVAPNRQIAQGFETLVVTLKNGKVEIGVFKADEGKQLRLITAEGKIVLIRKDQIDEQSKGKSAMPEDVLKHLSKRDLRDLVEFLAGLK